MLELVAALMIAIGLWLGWSVERESVSGRVYSHLLVTWGAYLFVWLGVLLLGSSLLFRRPRAAKIAGALCIAAALVPPAYLIWVVWIA